jgi:hypothetical protein
MKAIKTYYRGATNTRGSRLYATDCDHNKISIPYPHELNTEEGHALAANTLREKMGWKGRLIGGGLKDCMVWVFDDK